MAELEQIKVYSNSHYVTPKPTLEQAVSRIKNDLRIRLNEFNSAGRLLEAQGFRVGIIAQPDWRDAADFRALGFGDDDLSA